MNEPAKALEIVEGDSKLEKQIVAAVETAKLVTPDLAGRLNKAVIFNYLQMPDSSFGWSDGKPMSMAIKIMATLAHIQEGATPGYGQIIFLRDKLFNTAKFIANKANRDPEWKPHGEPIFVPLTDAERQAWGVGEKDMCVWVHQPVNHKGMDKIAKGLGILGIDEILKNKPGTQSTKDRAMSLQTRAWRDLYNRNYPTHIPIADHMEELQANVINAEVTEEPEPRTPVLTQIKENREDQELTTMKTAFAERLNSAMGKGMTTDAIEKELGENIEEIGKIKNADDLGGYVALLDDIVDGLHSEQNPVENQGKFVNVSDKAPSQDSPEKARKGRGRPRGPKKETKKKNEEDAPPPIQDSDIDLSTVFDPDPKPKTRPEGTEKAYRLLDQIQAHDNFKDAVLLERIEQLKTRKLRVDDQVTILEAAKAAQINGDFSAIDALLKHRESL